MRSWLSWLVVCYECWVPWLGFEGRVMEVGCFEDGGDNDLGLVVDDGEGLC